MLQRSRLATSPAQRCTVAPANRHRVCIGCWPVRLPAGARAADLCIDSSWLGCLTCLPGKSKVGHHCFATRRPVRSQTQGTNEDHKECLLLNTGISHSKAASHSTGLALLAHVAIWIKPLRVLSQQACPSLRVDHGCRQDNTCQSMAAGHHSWLTTGASSGTSTRRSSANSSSAANAFATTCVPSRALRKSCSYGGAAGRPSSSNQGRHARMGTSPRTRAPSALSLINIS